MGCHNRSQWHPITETHNHVGMETLGVRISRLRKAQKMTRQELARRSGVPYPTLSGLENGDQTATTRIAELAQALRVRAEYLATGKGPIEPAAAEPTQWADILASPQAVSAGDGSEAQEYAETYKLKFRADSLRRQGLHADKLVIYYANGDSMEPRIRKGDAIMFDTSDVRPTDDTIYVIQWRGELFAKRANIIDGTVYFQSDNPSGDHNWRKPRRMDDPKQPIEVLGRVRWIGSWEK